MNCCPGMNGYNSGLVTDINGIDPSLYDPWINCDDIDFGAILHQSATGVITNVAGNDLRELNKTNQQQQQQQIQSQSINQTHNNNHISSNHESNNHHNHNHNHNQSHGLSHSHGHTTNSQSLNLHLNLNLNHNHLQQHNNHHHHLEQHQLLPNQYTSIHQFGNSNNNNNNNTTNNNNSDSSNSSSSSSSTSSSTSSTSSSRSGQASNNNSNNRSNSNANGSNNTSNNDCCPLNDDSSHIRRASYHSGISLIQEDTTHLGFATTPTSICTEPPSSIKSECHIHQSEGQQPHQQLLSSSTTSTTTTTPTTPLSMNSIENNGQQPQPQPQQQQQQPIRKVKRCRHLTDYVLAEEEKRLLIKEGYTNFPMNCQDRLLSKAEERILRKIRRKIRNKKSAQCSRQRKKEYVEDLERKYAAVIKENEELKQILQQYGIQL